MSDTQNVICREIFIAAAPEAVFDFFVDPAMMARWIGQSHNSTRALVECFASRSAAATLRAASTRK